MAIEMPFEISDNTFLAMFRYALHHNADIICCGWRAEAMYFPLSVAMNAINHKAATRVERMEKVV
jgi:hypothetical protein